MPRPLTRSTARAATTRALRAAALTVLTGGAARAWGGRRTSERGGRARDRAPASRPRDFGALEIGAKRAMRAATLRDCGRRCVYCADALTFDTVTLDHVYPRAHGGPNIAGNVVAACGPCNRLKADLLPTEFFLRHPWAGLNFMRYARTVHRALKRGAR
ncbi:MAG TPA: HNH endonuclease signature motif containing protein, partial [Gemmatirosa sp.]